MTDDYGYDPVLKEKAASKCEKAKEARLQACRQMASAVRQRFTPASISKDQSPPELRIGINVAMSDLGGLIDLLVDKGIVTSTEVAEFLAASMKREASRYKPKTKKQK